jgi:hypothetical protein
VNWTGYKLLMRQAHGDDATAQRLRTSLTVAFSEHGDADADTLAEMALADMPVAMRDNARALLGRAAVLVRHQGHVI